MGNQMNNPKDKDLEKMVNDSNPIMLENIKSRALKIDKGKIIQNFNNYQDEYNSLNKHLEKLKNKMNIVISNDPIELIQKRLEELNKIVINEEIKNAISSFYQTYKNNLQNYYSYIGEIKKEYKNTYLIISNVLVGWQKEQKNINLEQEQSKVEEQLRKMSEVVNNFGKFSEVKELINKICYFELDSKDKDKFTIIDNYYNEKKEEIEQNYKFENVPQFRSIINLRDLLIETINQKNDFAQILEDFHKEYLNFYKVILKQVNSPIIEKDEIINEFCEYNNVIIYHRLIRSTEEKLKLIKLE
jgi:hypothetical protein